MLQVNRELLGKYGIFTKRDVSIITLKKIADEISKNKEFDFEYNFPLAEFTSKFCWKNLITIIELLDYPQKLKGLPILFGFLQDSNWPVFNEAIQAIMSYSKDDVITSMEKYLIQAHDEHDEMWTEGIYILSERMKIE